MLTDAQIEKAAREYCRLGGHDPDHVVSVQDPLVRGGVMLTVLRHKNVKLWQIHADAIREHWMLTQAIEAGMAEAQ